MAAPETPIRGPAALARPSVDLPSVQRGNPISATADAPVGGFDESPFLVEPSTPDSTPFSTSTPGNIERFMGRYGADGSATAASSPQASRAVERLDASRLSRGQSPLSDTHLAHSLFAAQNQAQHTSQPQRSMWQGAVGNVQDIATAILPWKLIPGLIQEVRELPDIQDHIQSAITRSENPAQFAGALAQAPGLRFVPGSYVVAELGARPDNPLSPGWGGGGVGELKRNPVFTALDILPYGISAARRSATVRKATELMETNTAATGQLPTRIRPLRTLARHYQSGGPIAQVLKPTDPRHPGGSIRDPANPNAYIPDPTPIQALQLNRFGEAMASGRAKFDGTKVGQMMNQTWGAGARGITSSVARFKGDIAQMIGGGEVGVARRKQLRDEGNTQTAQAAEVMSDLLESDLGKRFASEIDPTRRAQLGDLMVAGTPAAKIQLGKLKGLEREFVDKIETLLDNKLLEDLGVGDMTKHRDLSGRTEIFDRETGKRLAKARAAYDRAANVQTFVRDALESPGRYTPDELAHFAARMAADTSFSFAQRQALAASLGHAARAAYGGTFGEVFKPLVRSKNKAKMLEEAAKIERAMANLLSLQKTQPRVWYREIDGAAVAKAIAPYTRNKPPSHPLIRMKGHLADGNWILARREAKKVSDNVPSELRTILDNFVWDATQHRAMSMGLDRLVGIKGKEQWGADAVERTMRSLRDLERSTPPARYMSQLNVAANARLSSEFGKIAPDMDQAQVARLVDEGRWDQIPGSDAVDVKAVYREIEQTWMDLRDIQGFDPTYIPRTSEGRAKKVILDPTPMDTITKPAWMKERTWHESAHVRDPLVAVTAAAAETLVRNGQRALTEHITGTLALDGITLRERFSDQARGLAEVTGRTFQDTLDQLIRREGYQPWSPESMFGDGPLREGIAANAQLYLPRDIAMTLDRMKPSLSDLGTPFDKPTAWFRTALLPLSPRWHVYNVVGNTVMMLARARNPITVWQHTSEAWQMARSARESGGMFARDQRAIPTGEMMTSGQYASKLGGGFDREARALGLGRGSTKKFDPTALGLTEASRAQARYHAAAGMSLRRWYNQARDSRLAAAGHNVVQKSYEINNFMDNFSRSMAYLENTKHAARNMSPAVIAAGRKAGYTPEQIARAHGIAHSRRTLQEWDTMTPIERQALRFVMPFYSWTRTILRYVAEYPADHPWRLAITAQIARTELSDFATGLPQQMRDLLFLGEPDEWGNVTGVNITGSSPFRDLSNYASMVGFFGSGGKTGDLSAISTNLNPFMSVFVQWMGGDVMRGEAGLFPELVYNPQSGQLEVAQSDSPAQVLLESYIPQTRTLSAMFGFNEFYKDLAQRDPGAASRMLLSSMGVPVTHRRINIREQHAKEAITRLNALSDTRKSAFQSGDLDQIAAAYPHLAETVELLKMIQATGQFSAPQFDGNDGGGGVTGFVRNTLIPSNRVPTG